jgi:phenylacetic acid degradation operon negative regulatory protein
VPDGKTSLMARLLLVHHYRLALLDDPHLPPAALDPGWPGGRARALFADLYSRLSPAADAHIAQAFAAADGRLPAETEATRRRMLALAEA